ncbi:hypothetical protein N2152v2_009768 [Parachlorella kessleri]
MGSFEEDAGSGFFPHEREEPLARTSSSWSDRVSDYFKISQRNSGQMSEGDTEAPLLGDEQAARTPAASPPAGWPALRLSSVSTRKLRVGSWGAGDEQVTTPLAGGFPTGNFLPQPSPPQPLESIPLYSTTANNGGPYLPPAGPSASSTAAAWEEADSKAGGAGPSRRDQLANAAVCGAINSVIAMPIMLSFAAIIFRDPFFQPLLGSLVKVVFLSSALHQLAFTLWSSLPFAVGQVQDVGLIFLSAMASDVVASCARHGLSDADTVATALMVLTLSTTAVGLLIILTGLLKLASLVQYVPLPVVGGYLAYVGWFCLAAGISLASGVQVSTPETLINLANKAALIKLAPAVGAALLIALILRRFRSPFALPVLLLMIPAVFYVVLWAAGVSLEEAREAGWVSKPQDGDGEWKFWRLWSLYNIKQFPPANIYWGAMPSQVGKLVALFFVVAFGSSMDVAAIQAEAPRDLDYNQELTTVGLSNLLTGLLGVGYTGSYIFSQTLFSMRIGVNSPLMGAIIVVAELAVFMVPVNAMTYLPNLFFGSLVMWIGQDILKDWLFIAYKRVSLVEYVLLLGTLGAIMALGLEAGIAAGIVAAAVHFAYRYANVSVKAFAVVPSRSGAVRTFEQRTTLELFSARVLAVSLSGYLFFGSSVKVSEQVMKVATATLDSLPHKAAGAAASPHADTRKATACPAGSQGPSNGSSRSRHVAAGGQSGAAGVSEGPPPLLDDSGEAASQQAQRQGVLQAQHAQQQAPKRGGGRAATSLLPTVVSGVLLDDTHDAIQHFSGDARGWAAAALEQAPRFLILDFRRVQGLDATAARTFVTLHSKLHRKGIQLIITHLPTSRPGICKLLVAQGLILRRPAEAAAGAGDSGDGGPACRWFSTMEAGLQYCEEQFLEVAVRYRLCRPMPCCVTLGEVLRAHLEFPRSSLPGGLDSGAAAAQLARFTAHEEIRQGEVLFERGDPADAIYIIECGGVLCAVDFMLTSVHSRAANRVLPQELTDHNDRIFKYGPAGIVGELDFFLERPRSFSAVCEQSGSVWRISRHSFERMAREQPQVLALLQTIILRATSLSVAHALEALERSSPE